MIIPESISALVWQMKHKWIWTVGMVLVSIVMMALMLETSRGYGSLYETISFLSCSCIAFVGAMPLFLKETNKAHYTLAIIGSLLSQVWCLMIVSESKCSLLEYILWWVLGAMIMLDFKKYWCLIAEIWIVISLTACILFFRAGQ